MVKALIANALFRKRTLATSVIVPVTEPSCIDLRRFDSFTAAEVTALPRTLRRQVIADRKARVTAALRRGLAA